LLKSSKNSIYKVICLILILIALFAFWKLNFSEKNFSDLNSIFDYHEIDSITFVENNIYYVSKPKIYMKIFDSVKFELEEIQDGLSQELLDNVNYDEKYLKNQNKK
jgi:hypothetical protein